MAASHYQGSWGDGGSSRRRRRHRPQRKDAQQQQQAPSRGPAANSCESREEILRRREADVARREAAVASEEEQAKALVREFGATTSLGSEDVVAKVSDLTTKYVKDVLRAVWMAGRADVATAMCAAFDGAPALGHPRSRSRSRSRSEMRQRSETSLRDRDEAVEEYRDEKSSVISCLSVPSEEKPAYDEELPDFDANSDC